AILVRMTSTDVVHSLFLPDFKVKEDSMPGRVTYLWFLPKKPGEHILTCTEYCGVMHSMMHGKVIAMEEAAFNKWLSDEQAKLSKGGA
ncbi:MAG: cytochrome c oxidase subunit II, partial [Thermodesulfobacteriota bacterium]